MCYKCKKIKELWKICITRSFVIPYVFFSHAVSFLNHSKSFFFITLHRSEFFFVISHLFFFFLSFTILFFCHFPSYFFDISYYFLSFPIFFLSFPILFFCHFPSYFLVISHHFFCHFPSFSSFHIFFVISHLIFLSFPILFFFLSVGFTKKYLNKYLLPAHTFLIICVQCSNLQKSLKF